MPEQDPTALRKATGISRGRSRLQQTLGDILMGGVDVLTGALGIPTGIDSKGVTIGELLTAGVPILGGVKAAQAAKRVANPKAFDFSPGFKSVQIGPTEIQLSVGKNGTAEVVMVKTPPSQRGQGSARKAMERLTKEADASGLRLELTPDPMDASTKKAGLTRFYESMGFRRNQSDFSTRRTHIREPQRGQ